MTLREAAGRTLRSVTTLRRYIRSGKLQAEKKRGRYGPEYFVTEGALAEAGLYVATGQDGGPPVREQALATAPDTLGRALQETVPLTLHQELMMKHEQLLVQYGMMRVGGMRLLELRAELESRQQTIEESRAEISRLQRQLTTETSRRVRRVREAELQLESKRLQIATLKEKMRQLEMLTRNTVTTETIELQFAEVMKQMRRVDQLTAGPEDAATRSADWTAGKNEETDH